MKRLIIPCFFSMLILVLTGCVQTRHLQSVEHKEVTSFQQIREILNQLNSGTSLVVLDVDNTVLKMNDNLGSVAWYDWQQDLEQTQVKEPGEIGNELAVQGVLYSTRDMSLTEAQIPALINSLKSSGIDVIALTARGPEFRDATINQLNRNSIAFSTSHECQEPLCNKRGLIEFQHIKKLAEEVYGRDALDKNEFKSGRNLSAADGVIMVAGQNKGIILSLFLKSVDKAYSQIVFVDDSMKNVKAMADFAPYINAHMTIVHYTRLNEQAEEFRTSAAEQEQVKTAWDNIAKALCVESKPEWCSQL